MNIDVLLKIHDPWDSPDSSYGLLGARLTRHENLKWDAYSYAKSIYKNNGFFGTSYGGIAHIIQDMAHYAHLRDLLVLDRTIVRASNDFVLFPFEEGDLEKLIKLEDLC